MTSTSWPTLKPLTVSGSVGASSPSSVNSRDEPLGRGAGLLEVAEFGLGHAVFLLVERADLDRLVTVVLDRLDLQNRVRFRQDDGDGRDDPGVVIDAGHPNLLS